MKLEITVQRQFMKKAKKIPRSLWSYSDQNPMNAAFFDVDPQKNSANTTVSQYQVKKKETKTVLDRALQRERSKKNVMVSLQKRYNIIQSQAKTVYNIPARNFVDLHNMEFL